MAEVVVVGASVAGAATAIHLARLGRDVLLCDKSATPGRKACGEGLFPAGVRRLRELGALDVLECAATIERLRFEGYGETAEARMGSPEAPALGVSREALGAGLLAAAKAAGVRLELRQTVRLSDEGDHFEATGAPSVADARVIVAADGLNSSLRRQAGIAVARPGRRYGVSGHIELREAPAPAVNVHFRRGFEVYVTPVGERVANVAVLISKADSRVLAGAAHGTFEALLMRSRCLPEGWRLVDPPLAAGPFPQRPERLWRRNLVLAGDAAGFFDGITGEGMSLALLSARDCAQAVDAHLHGEPSAFETYERKRRALARNSELLGRLTLLLASRPWSARRAIRGLGTHPAAFERMLAVSSGEAALRSLRPLDLLAPLLG